ncbi:MAG: tripartite tricarboxylate transporter substrate binding protein [Alphaproteobacteria bacterium]|nr:tripartite tricarboxylate transporter substrate binding protein [Alphaproteobacteria bacterium]
MLAIGTRPSAAAWPADKPNQIIVPFPPGGGVDLLSRMMAPYLAKHLPGSRWVVVNRPGASGQVGFMAVAQSAPDGYTSGMITLPSLTNALVEQQANYKLDDFTYIAGLAYDASALLVKADSPFRTLGDFIAEAKRRPGQLNVGNTGVGGPLHLMALLLANRAGIQFEHVPYLGTAPARTALIGGHVHAAGFSLGEAWPFILQGDVRVLASASAERSTLFAAAPTYREQGVDVVMGTTRGLMGPKGIPAPIVSAYVDAVRKTLEDPAFKAEAERGFQPMLFLDSVAYRRLTDETFAQGQQLFQQTPWR